MNLVTLRSWAVMDSSCLLFLASSSFAALILLPLGTPWLNLAPWLELKSHEKFVSFRQNFGYDILVTCLSSKIPS